MFVLDIELFLGHVKKGEGGRQKPAAGRFEASPPSPLNCHTAAGGSVEGPYSVEQGRKPF